MSYIFPKWMNALPAAAVVGLGFIGTLVVVGGWYYLTPDYFEVGYEPTQPIDYNHQLHAGELGIDCRYCHSQVEDSPHSNIPAVQTCMGCHAGDDATDIALLNNEKWQSHKNNQNLIQVRTHYETGEAIQWRRIHKLPDYAKFNHAVHVNAGVSCYSCHGRMDQQVVARQVESLAMGWCLDCHRDPSEHLVDVDGLLGEPVRITDLATVQHTLGDKAHASTTGEELARIRQLQPPQGCAACHY